MFEYSRSRYQKNIVLFLYKEDSKRFSGKGGEANKRKKTETYQEDQESQSYVQWSFSIIQQLGGCSYEVEPRLGYITRLYLTQNKIK